MEKLQVLFPEPQLGRLRRIARAQDRPVSELVRLAVDAWLARQGDEALAVALAAAEEAPTYGCGPVMLGAEQLRDAAYEDRSAR